MGALLAVLGGLVLGYAVGLSHGFGIAYKYWWLERAQRQQSSCANPTYKHNTLESARREAARLALRHGKEYYVLVSVATARPPRVEWIEHETTGDVPF